jgi:hypothetical protein
LKTLLRQTWRRRSVAVGILMFFLAGNGMIPAKTEKPGATIVVQKLDGQTIRGELLEAKDGILNLLVYENATKVGIRLDELSSVRIEKKSTFLKGFGIGILAGAATGALLGFMSGNEEPSGPFDIFTFTAGEKAFAFGVVLGGFGGVIGGFVGALKGIDKTISLNALSPEKMHSVEARLASLARFKPDPIAEYIKRNSKEPE